MKFASFFAAGALALGVPCRPPPWRKDYVADEVKEVGDHRRSRRHRRITRAIR